MENAEPAMMDSIRKSTKPGWVVGGTILCFLLLLGARTRQNWFLAYCDWLPVVMLTLVAISWGYDLWPYYRACETRALRIPVASIFVFAIFRITPLLLGTLRDVPYQVWLYQQGMLETLSSSWPYQAASWAPTRVDGNWNCNHASGRQYLPQQGITAIYDTCELATNGLTAHGILRVNRNGMLQYFTLAGPLSEKTFTALGRPRPFRSGSVPAVVLGVSNWEAVWHGADRLAVACTTQECGVVSGYHLDRFLPLGADRILDFHDDARALTAFRRKDGWYTIEGTSTRSIRGPFAPGQLTLDFGDLFERTSEGWLCLTNGRVTVPRPVPLDEFPTDIAPGRSGAQILAIPVVGSARSVFP